MFIMFVRCIVRSDETLGSKRKLWKHICKIIMNIKKEFHENVETGIRVVSNKIIIWEIKCKLLDMTICMTPMVLEINAKMCIISSDA